MRIQVVSDLHLEFHNRLPPVAKGADALVCAGDLAPIGAGAVRYAAEEWAGARHILYVPGNHEFYGADIDRARKQLAEECATHGITLLDTDAIVIDDVHFIGATLWTDFLLDGVARESGAHRAALGISDFDGSITHRGGTKRFTTYELVQRHTEERAFIEDELADAERDGTTAVVITHHSPTPRSIAPRFLGNALNPAFASNLEPLIARYQPALWIHGHIHNSVDVTLGATRVLANPGGYNAAENPEYDPALCVEVEARAHSSLVDHSPARIAKQSTKGHTGHAIG